MTEQNQVDVSTKRGGKMAKKYGGGLKKTGGKGKGMVATPAMPMARKGK